MTPAIMSRFDLFFVLLDEVDETTDMMVAKHIITVHQNRELPRQADIFSTEQLQRYIRFARSMRPKITPESVKVIVDHYRTLRQNDAGGVGKSSYRITVRQLESIIRLSEAIARVHMDDRIQVQYVHEAVRLLRKSIIHVDMDAVNLETTSDELDDADLNMDGGENGQNLGQNGENAGQNDGQNDGERRPMVIPYDKFKQISNMIVMHLRRSDEAERAGLRQSEIVEWYLQQMEVSEADGEVFAAEQQLVARVIKHLVVKEHILLVLRTLESLPEGPSEEEEDPVLVVHPNYVPETE